ncbi:hypothetical protein QBC43DRAFT_305185 [Cladorrhinum sp. PSN259]|nr:hypothetical protein QBC43DRAFT_305185 [Cladorrhinum sp. PSN259]
MGTTSSTENGSEEASAFLTELLKTHFVAVMRRRYKQEAATIAEGASANPDLWKLAIPCLIIALKEDNDLVLATFLEAALHFPEDDDPETTTAIEVFFQQLLRPLASQDKPGSEVQHHQETFRKSTEMKSLLLGVFEDLLIRHGSDLEGEEYPDGDDETSSCDSSTSHLEDDGPLQIFMGESVMARHVSFDAILHVLWLDGLASDCHYCSEPFLDEPPIRTFRNSGDSEDTLVKIQVFNRHFRCLKEAGQSIVPISHVWHDPIRDANYHGPSVPAKAATSIIIKSLKDLFKATEEKYHPQTEFWHDYISVPQWEHPTKKALLAWLPTLYRHADEILVHMADMPSPFVSLILIRGILSSPCNIKEAIDYMLPLRTLCSSEWMQRMWVTLEYAQCKEACIMDKYNNIIRSPGDAIAPIFGRDVFTNMIRGAHRQVNELCRYASTFTDTLTLPGEFLGRLTETGGKRDETRVMCLGEAVEVINRKQCFEETDRYLALYLILNPEATPTSALAIPPNVSDACIWLWKHELLKGDYSPLLIQPREIEQGSNPGESVPSWAVGCSGLKSGEWRMGSLNHDACGIGIYSDGRTLRIELQLVGRIETIYHLEVGDCGKVSGIEWSVRLLITLAEKEGRTAPSAQDILRSVSSIFPLDITHAARRSEVSPDTTMDRLQESFIALAEEKLGILRHIDGSSSPMKEQVIHELAKAAAETLQFELLLWEPTSKNVSRLNRSRVLAERRRERGVQEGEPICLVQCPGCGRSTLLRLDLRQTARVGDEVYRIPHLSYDETIEDGVGLILCPERRITGRMLYGSTTCRCQSPSLVEIR